MARPSPSTELAVAAIRWWATTQGVNLTQTRGAKKESIRQLQCAAQNCNWKVDVARHGTEWKVSAIRGNGHHHGPDREVILAAFSGLLDEEKEVLQAAGTSAHAMAWSLFFVGSRKAAGYKVDDLDNDAVSLWIRDETPGWIRPRDVALPLRIAPTPTPPTPSPPSPSPQAHDDGPALNTTATMSTPAALSLLSGRIVEAGGRPESEYAQRSHCLPSPHDLQAGTVTNDDFDLLRSTTFASRKLAVEAVESFAQTRGFTAIRGSGSDIQQPKQLNWKVWVYPDGDEWKVGVPSGDHSHAGSTKVVEQAFKGVLPVEKAVLLAAAAVTTEATAWTDFWNDSREQAGYDVGLKIKDRQPVSRWIRGKMATWVRPNDVALPVRMATPPPSPWPSPAPATPYPLLTPTPASPSAHDDGPTLDATTTTAAAAAAAAARGRWTG